MVVAEKKTAKKLIKDLLLVLSFGVVSAIVVALLALYFLGPSGTYKAGNILLAPDVAYHLSYSEINAQTRKPVPYIFDHIELLQFNKDSREWQRFSVEKNGYEHFYSLISDDRSLTPVPDYVADLFGKESPSRLSILVKETGLGSGQSKTFQEIQILNYSDYYRIQLREQGKDINWIYFFHENIYQESMKVLVIKDE